MFLGVFHGELLGRCRIGFGEMRARDNDRARGGNERLVDVALVERIISAIITVENQRELFVVADAQNNKRCEPVFVGMNALCIDALALELFADKAAHMLVANAGDEAAFKPQTRRADGDIGGRSTNGFREGCHILKPSSDLLAIKIHR